MKWLKIRIEIDEGAEDDEIIIRCREFNKSIQKIQNYVLELSSQTNLVFYKNLTEYFLPLNSILFFAFIFFIPLCLNFLYRLSGGIEPP